MVSIEASDLDFVCCCQSMEFVSDFIIIQQWFPYHYKQVISVWPEQCQWAVGVFPFKWIRLCWACPTLERSRSAKLQLLPPSAFCLLICKVSGCLSKSAFMLCTVQSYPLFAHLMTRMILFILVECVDILSECMIVRRDGWLVMDL